MGIQENFYIFLLTEHGCSNCTPLNENNYASPDFSRLYDLYDVDAHKMTKQPLNIQVSSCVVFVENTPYLDPH